MATNFYFNNFESSAEQTLIEDLVIESIKIYGHDLIYLPRTIVNRDFVFNEDGVSKFVDNYMVEMYIRDVDGFQGEGDFLSKFGVEVRDQITFTVANRRFDEDIAGPHGITRPREGDVIYFPLTSSFYEIKFVEHEAVFYQLGQLQMYDLRCELYEYSGEEFSTGSDLLDAIEDNTKINLLDYSLLTQSSNTSLDSLLLANETGGPIIREIFNINTITKANNSIYQAESVGIIDFSELDPFSEGTY